MPNGTLTYEDMKRVHRCRLRYRAGLPVPAGDLHALGLTMDVNGAKEVLGLYLEPNRPPTVEGSAGLWFGPIVCPDGVTS